MNIETVISIWECTSPQNFSQLDEIQIMVPNLPKNMNEKYLGKINMEIVISIRQCTPVPSFT